VLIPDSTADELWPLKGATQNQFATQIAASYMAKAYEGTEGPGQMSEDFYESHDKKENRLSTPDKPTRCDVEHCGRPAMCSLELRRICVDHFIAECYDRLNHCNASPFADPGAAESVSIDRFLHSCAQQAASLVHPIRGLDNLERARLFDILLWSSELAAKRTVFKSEKAAGASC
jgi:hypothetical protein